MIEMKPYENTESNFLSFSLVAQQLITVAFAVYSFCQQQMLLAIFYMSVASILCVALGIFYVLKRLTLARLLLVSTLAVGFLFLLVGSSDQTSLIWCLTVVPVLMGTLGCRQSTILLVAIFAVSIWLILSDVAPFETVQYDNIIILHLLSSFVILAMFSFALDNSFFNSLRNYDALSSKVHNITHRDMLTNLPNRHHMEERLKLKYQQYRLGDEPFSVVLADMDNFKAINDRYGRDTGDKILKSMGDLLNSELREGDLIARWSGNQFILLLPNLNLEVAPRVAERLREKVSQLTVEAQGDQLNLTVSMGVACVAQCAGLDDLLSCAENATYQAKHMGRNMVIVS
jgi:diguanylate cyclase (GGDEF)-like protein